MSPIGGALGEQREGTLPAPPAGEPAGAWAPAGSNSGLSRVSGAAQPAAPRLGLAQAAVAKAITEPVIVALPYVQQCVRTS